MIKSPCMGCTSRTAGCHAKCRSYNQYRQEMDAKRVMADKETKINEACVDMHNSRYAKVHKKANLRRKK